jgi:protease IV
MRFLGNVLATIVGLLIFSVISFFILAGIIAVISSSEDEVTVKENSILLLDLNGRTLVERTNENNPDFSMLPLFGPGTDVGLLNLKRAIDTAKENENIKGIYLKAGLFMAGQAGLSELRQKLEDFKSSGKFIISYSEVYSEGGYYLSSVADEVYMNPLGGMDFNGFSSEMIFLKGFFEKIEVEPVIFRVGEYKSAVEPFLLKSMSEENRMQTESFLRDMNDYALGHIGESRGISVEEVTEINNKMLVRKAQDAVDYRLIDGLWYEDQIIDALKEKLGLEEDDKINTVNVTKMNKSSSTKNRLSRNRIAVIVAEGEIVSGEVEGAISSDIFKDQLKKARQNKDIKAIVLRINSPGGSILASEVLWREIDEARKVKPVIASMGEVAASGGYYLAAPADTIVAQPNTITGSIGIFGIWFNAQGLLNNKLGVTVDVAKTGELSDFMNPARKLSDLEKSIVQQNVEDGYDVFISRVASGRNLSKEQVLAVASGRVWSGLQAKNNGLVDVLGNLEDAITIAANKAGVEDDYRVVYYPEEKPWFEKFMSQMTNEVKVLYRQKQLGNFYPVYEQIEKMRHFEGVLVRMPQDIVIK